MSDKISRISSGIEVGYVRDAAGNWYIQYPVDAKTPQGHHVDFALGDGDDEFLGGYTVASWSLVPDDGVPEDTRKKIGNLLLVKRAHLMQFGVTMAARHGIPVVPSTTREGRVRLVHLNDTSHVAEGRCEYDLAAGIKQYVANHKEKQSP